MLAKWLDQNVGRQDVIVVLLGLLSAIEDNLPLVAASMGMYSLTPYPTDSFLWEFIAYCAGTGESIRSSALRPRGGDGSRKNSLLLVRPSHQRPGAVGLPGRCRRLHRPNTGSPSMAELCSPRDHQTSCAMTRTRPSVAIFPLKVSQGIPHDTSGERSHGIQCKAALLQCWRLRSDPTAGPSAPLPTKTGSVSRKLR